MTRPARLATAAIVVLVGLLIAVKTGWLSGSSVDGRLVRDAHRASLHHHHLLRAARDTTRLGSPGVVNILAIVATLGLFVARRYRDAFFVAGSRLIAWLASTTIKSAVDRSRPHFATPLGHWSGGSFPSGHSSGAASVYLPLAALLAASASRRATRTAVFVVAVLGCLAVAASRVFLGAHYPSGVIAGLALGAAAPALCWATAQHSAAG